MQNLEAKKKVLEFFNIKNESTSLNGFDTLALANLKDLTMMAMV